jgi:dextranase
MTVSKPSLLLPTRASYRPSERVGIEVRHLTGPARLLLYRLGDLVSDVEIGLSGVVDLGLLPAGGYSVELRAGEVLARTAVEVVAESRSVLRYGFVVDYRPGRDLKAVQDNLRRLHLTGVQFYDWAYRHADLLGGGERYDDALGQPVSLDTVRELIEVCHQVGADALGYAAVYAVGPHEWPKWEHDALLTASGQPYALGDFLFVLDPAAPDWLDHFSTDLRQATDQLGFDGFHLDQYGYPKWAHRPDGSLVDVASSFRSMIAGVRQALPQSRLVFNNVNDFPTWASAAAPQDAVYIEVWPPHVGYQHLAQVVTRARHEAAGKPVVIAAYQHVYDQVTSAEIAVEAADTATGLTMATLFSHGASHLLCGEADRILVDPYYVRNHEVADSTADLLHRWYDFAVAHGELLFDPELTEVTGSFAGSYNDDLDVSYAEVQVETLAVPGTVWRRVIEGGERSGAGPRYVVHLINLTGQSDTCWDAARQQPGDPGRGQLRIRRMGGALPRVRYADPDAQDRLIEVPVTVDGDYLVADLPSPQLWQLVVIEPAVPRSAVESEVT